MIYPPPLSRAFGPRRELPRSPSPAEHYPSLTHTPAYMHAIKRVGDHTTPPAKLHRGIIVCPAAPPPLAPSSLPPLPPATLPPPSTLPVECPLTGQQVCLDPHDVDAMLLLGQLVQRIKHWERGGGSGVKGGGDCQGNVIGGVDWCDYTIRDVRPGMHAFIQKIA